MEYLLGALAVAAIIGGLVYMMGYTKGGERVRMAQATASATPSESLEDAFVVALASALTGLSQRTKTGEDTAARHLEVALAYAERSERAKGGKGGAEFRVTARPLLVAMLRYAEDEHGTLIRDGRVTAKEAVVAAMGDL